MVEKAVRSLGIDIGEKRTGIALSDPLGIVATPLLTIIGGEQETVLKAIIELVQQHQVERIVVGLPRSLNGDIGKEAVKIQTIVQQLSEHSEVPVETWDERLSTVAAERLMRETGAKRQQRKINRDAVAAAVILQSYLNRQEIKSPEL